MTMHEISILEPAGYEALLKDRTLRGEQEPSGKFLLLRKLEDKPVKELEDIYERQKEFLKIVCGKSSEKLPDLLFKKCGKKAETVSVSLPKPFEDCEFGSPTRATETKYWKLWQKIAPRRAAISSWWASLHLNMIQQGVIQASYLASSGRVGETGEIYIERALKEGNIKEQIGIMDKCIRGIFRHLGGIPIRGHRTAYLDCKTARGWWRRRFAEEAAQVYNSVSVDNIHQSLRIPAIWELLCQYIISNLTAIGDQNLRSALLAFLGETYSQDNKKAPVFYGKQFKKLLLRLGRRTTWQVFGVLDADEILEIVRQEAEAAQQEVAE